MRWTAKASLFAGVATIAVSIGFVPQPTNFPSSTIYDAVPVQLGSVAHAQARLSVGIFFDRLQPHGRWVRHRAHGLVFVPAGVGRDWRPYTAGRWVHTSDHGWYWLSDEPFGWATYHYGRWGYSRIYGWYWVPGNVWAPAWVTWRTGDDVIGWAPLAPERRGYSWGTPSAFRPPVAESWVFVETRYVTAPRLVQYVTPIVEIPVYLSRATTRVDLRVEQNIVINQPIEITQIENVLVEPVQTMELTFSDDPEAAASTEAGIVAFQADISEEEPEEVPANIVESPEELDEPVLIEETLDEVPADADAPSASEVEDDEAAEPEAEAPAEDDEPIPAETEEELEEPAAEPEAEEGEVETSPEGPVTEETEPTPEEPVEEEAEEPARDQPAPEQPPAAEEEAPAEPAEPEAQDQEDPEPAEMPAESDAPVDGPAEPEDGEAETSDEQPAEEQVCPEGQETC